MSIETYLIYLGVLGAFFATPPDTSQLLIISNSLRHGLRRSLATVAGDLSANAVQMTLAAFGLTAVIAANARLTAQWMAAGFVHGVLNTDNLNVTGESFDYGPWRFLPLYDPGFTAAYFDETGLYAYARQPDAVFWNLQQLASCLALTVEDTKPLVQALQAFPDLYKREVAGAFLKRLGVLPRGEDDDTALLQSMLGYLRESQAPWERFFYDWFGGIASVSRAKDSPEAHLYQGEPFQAFYDRLERYAPDRPERLDHAYFQRGAPSTLVYEDVTSLWAKIAEDDDWSLFEAKLAEIDRMRDALA